MQKGPCTKFFEILLSLLNSALLIWSFRIQHQPNNTSHCNFNHRFCEAFPSLSIFFFYSCFIIYVMYRLMWPCLTVRLCTVVTPCRWACHSTPNSSTNDFFFNLVHLGHHTTFPRHSFPNHNTIWRDLSLRVEWELGNASFWDNWRVSWPWRQSWNMCRTTCSFAFACIMIYMNILFYCYFWTNNKR